MTGAQVQAAYASDRSQELKRERDTRILVCGHQPTPHSDMTTGTAHTTDGREICWTCADAEQREALKTAASVTLYLDGDGARITTWSGGEMMRVVYKVKRRVGFGGASRYYLDAVDATGRRWYGQSPGPNMYASLRARKR